MGLGLLLFFWGGLATPIISFKFCLINISNTVSIGSIVKVNGAQCGHPCHDCLPHLCYRTVLPDGVILHACV